VYAKENILYIQDSGVGIQLDIVKRLCDSMDINISVSSVVGEGTLIVIRF
jgi:chemotaxis protein histidine kinase CheA